MTLIASFHFTRCALSIEDICLSTRHNVPNYLPKNSPTAVTVVFPVVVAAVVAAVVHHLVGRIPQVRQEHWMPVEEQTSWWQMAFAVASSAAAASGVASSAASFAKSAWSLAQGRCWLVVVQELELPTFEASGASSSFAAA